MVLLYFTNDLFAVKCDTKDGRACKFPFEGAEGPYNGCLTEARWPGLPDREPWCETTTPAYCPELQEDCYWGDCKKHGWPPHDGMHIYVV